MPFTTIDLCAGIGGMRKGFELTGYFHNVLAAEIDKYACMTYQHLYGDDANHDLTSEEFKAELDTIQYDVLLAGFPCQTFSKAGLEEGFNDTEKGIRNLKYLFPSFTNTRSVTLGVTVKYMLKGALILNKTGQVSLDKSGSLDYQFEILK